MINQAKMIKGETEHRNAKDWPRSYTCKFIEPGLISYEDMDAGVVLVNKGALDAMAKSFEGKPVMVQHDDVSPENFEEKAEGVVSKVYFNDADGWYYADFIVWNDKAKQLIENSKWNVSCAYKPTEVDSKGGRHNNINYDMEVLNGEYTHLAIVPNPRYERAQILLNSLGGRMLKKLKDAINGLQTLVNGMPEEKKEEEKKEEKENEMGTPPGSGASPVEPVKKDDAPAEKKEEVTLDEIVGMLSTLTEIIKKHIGAEEKVLEEKPVENAEEKEEKKEEPKEEKEEKKNSLGTEEGKAGFKKLKEAANARDGGDDMEISSMESRCSKGSGMYGSTSGGK